MQQQLHLQPVPGAVPVVTDLSQLPSPQQHLRPVSLAVAAHTAPGVARHRRGRRATVGKPRRHAEKRYVEFRGRFRRQCFRPTTDDFRQH